MVYLCQFCNHSHESIHFLATIWCQTSQNTTSGQIQPPNHQLQYKYNQTALGPLYQANGDNQSQWLMDLVWCGLTLFQLTIGSGNPGGFGVGSSSQSLGYPSSIGFHSLKWSSKDCLQKHLEDFIQYGVLVGQMHLSTSCCIFAGVWHHLRSKQQVWIIYWWLWRQSRKRLPIKNHFGISQASQYAQYIGIDFLKYFNFHV